MPDNQPTPASVPSPALPPARRLNRLALGLGLSLGALVFVAGALVLTSQKAPQGGRDAGPKDQRPAEAAFLNNPPRTRPADSAERAEKIEDARIAALLRAARQPASSSGPFTLGPRAPGSAQELPTDLEAASSPAGMPLPVGDNLPPGVYRPLPSYGRVNATSTAVSPAARPSWQMAFASGLLPASGASAPEAVPSLPTFPFPTTALSTPGLPPKLPAADPQASTVAAVPSRPEARGTEPSGSRRNSVAVTGTRQSGRVLRAGTVLNAILLTAVSTDMPGDAVAQLRADVYAADGSLLLPKGTRLIGSYENRVSLGDHRLALAWDRIIVEGRSYDLPGLPSTSPDGAAGLPGEINNHTGLVFGRAALLSLIGAGAQLGQPRQSRLGAALGNREVIAGSVSQQLSQAATELLTKAIDVEPTINVPAGERLTVLLPYDLELSKH